MPPFHAPVMPPFHAPSVQSEETIVDRTGSRWKVRKSNRWTHTPPCTKSLRVPLQLFGGRSPPILDGVVVLAMLLALLAPNTARAGTLLRNREQPKQEPCPVLNGHVSLSKDSEFRYLPHDGSVQEILATGSEVTDEALEAVADLDSVEELRLSNTQITDRGLQYLVRLPKLRVLHLQNAPISDRGLEYVAQLKSLESLSLSGTSVGDLGMAALKGQFPNSLDLSRTRITNKTLEYLEKAGALQSLYLDQTAVTDEGVAHLSKLKGLRNIGLYGTSVGDQGLAAICECQVTSITVGSRTTDKGLTPLKAQLQLATLGLEGSRVTDAGFDIVGDLRPLSSLSLAGPQVTSAAFTHISRLPWLSKLVVARVAVQMNDLRHLQRLQHLRTLAFEDCRIGVDELRVIHKIGSLKQLHLVRANLTDGSADALSAMSNLQFLSLLENRIGSKAMKQIRTSLPRTVVAQSDQDSSASK